MNNCWLSITIQRYDRGEGGFRLNPVKSGYVRFFPDKSGYFLLLDDIY